MIDDEFFGPAILPATPKQPGTAYGGKRNTIKNNSNYNNGGGGAESNGSRVVSGGRNRNNDTESQY